MYPLEIFSISKKVSSLRKISKNVPPPEASEKNSPKIKRTSCKNSPETWVMKRRALIYVYYIPGCMENEIRSYLQEIFRFFLNVPPPQGKFSKM